MPLTREQSELATVAGHQNFKVPNVAACDRHIAKLTDLIQHPGQATPAAVRCWREDRDLLLDRRFYLTTMEA